MRRQIFVPYESDHNSTMAKDMKMQIVFQFLEHDKNSPSSGHLATPAHKNHREKDTKTKKRRAKNNSTTAKKPRHSESKKKNSGNWIEFNVHLNSAHELEEKNEKARKSTEWQCEICKKSFTSNRSLKRHVTTTHSKTAVECDYCGGKFTFKQNLKRHMKRAHFDNPPDAVAAVTKKAVLKKDNEKISNHTVKVHSGSGAPLKEVAALREKTGVIKDTSPSTEPPKVPVKKFTEYECTTCGKTEDTYDASVRHAQQHLVEWDALIRENGTQCELKFDRHNRGNNSNRPLIETKFDYKTLLDKSNKWISMFDTTDHLSTDHVWSSSILGSSLYKYTRCVKLNWDSEKKGVGEGHCVPLYKCSACDLFVDPAKVERHCENYQACERYKGYECTKCEKKFNAPNVLKLHMKDHDTYKNLRFRIVTFNNEDDEQFNMALRRMSLFSQAEKQEKISGSPETPERNVLQKNDVHNMEIRVLKYCPQCERSYSDLEDHSAYHKNKSKRIMETIAREQQSCSAEAAEAVLKKQKKAEQEENVSDNDNIRKDSNIRRGNVQEHQQNSNKMAFDKESAVVMEWNSDGDSDDDDQSFNTFSSQAQLNLIPKHFGRIVTKEDEIKQKTYNDCWKFQGNPENDDDAVKEEKHDQFDQCELTLGRIFGEDNNGVDTLESDNESQSTEDVRRVLEGDAESVLSDDE